MQSHWENETLILYLFGKYLLTTHNCAQLLSGIGKLLKESQIQSPALNGSCSLGEGPEKNRGLSGSILWFPLPWVALQWGQPYPWIASSLRPFSLFLMLLPGHCSNQIIWQRLCLSVPNLKSHPDPGVRDLQLQIHTHLVVLSPCEQVALAFPKVPSKHFFQAENERSCDFLAVIENYYKHCLLSLKKHSLCLWLA